MYSESEKHAAGVNEKDGPFTTAYKVEAFRKPWEDAGKMMGEGIGQAIGHGFSNPLGIFLLFWFSPIFVELFAFSFGVGYLFSGAHGSYHYPYYVGVIAGFLGIMLYLLFFSFSLTAIPLSIFFSIECTIKIFNWTNKVHQLNIDNWNNLFFNNPVEALELLLTKLTQGSAFWAISGFLFFFAAHLLFFQIMRGTRNTTLNPSLSGTHDKKSNLGQETTGLTKLHFTDGTIPIPKFGAIVYSPSTRQYASSYGLSTFDEAIQSALSNCQSHDAMVLTCISDCWLALALSPSGAYGWAFAHSAEAARNRALLECNQYDSGSYIEICFSTSDGEIVPSSIV